MASETTGGHVPAIDRIKELRAALAEAERQKWNALKANGELATWIAQREDELTAELARKDAALRRYGSHDWDCPKSPWLSEEDATNAGAVCFCGFTEASGQR